MKCIMHVCRRTERRSAQPEAVSNPNAGRTVNEISTILCLNRGEQQTRAREAIFLRASTRVKFPASVSKNRGR